MKELAGYEYPQGIALQDQRCVSDFKQRLLIPEHERTENVIPQQLRPTAYCIFSIQATT